MTMESAIPPELWPLRSHKLVEIDAEIAAHKAAIRRRRLRLQAAARTREELLETLKQFGIEVVEQGEEDNTHGH